MLGNIVLARTHAGSEKNVIGWMKEAERAAIRAKDLARQLITFSRGGLPVKAVIAISSIIEEAARFALLGSGARCEFFLPDDLWPIEADAGQIGQVVNNLLINANQAMPEGGTVSIVGDNLSIGEKTALPLQPGPYIRIRVKDTGIGMTKELLAKIFDPYFTTKQTGSGLGLATSYSILKKHNGHIAVESRLGAGTTFTLYLPAAPGKQEKEPSVGGKLMTGVGNILFMDDDDAIRSVAKDMLEFLGYNVTTVSRGEEAIEAYKKTFETGAPYDLVITDLTVSGGMGGRELIGELLAIDPHARVIVSSGYSDDPIMASFREYRFSGVVVKPYTNAELAKVVSAVIRERGQSPSHA